jgi:hypothetical protein
MDRSFIKSLTGDFGAHATEVDGVECWFARDLQYLHGFVQWRNFLLVIDKAKISCQTAGCSMMTILLTSPKWSKSAQRRRRIWLPKSPTSIAFRGVVDVGMEHEKERKRYGKK